MSTVRTCTTPKDGWALIHHFLRNSVPVIALATERFREESDAEKRSNQADAINSAWARLIGNLYMIIRNMRANDHYEEAEKMQWLLDLITNQDFTGQEAIQNVVTKEEELNPELQNFEQIVKKLFPK